MHAVLPLPQRTRLSHLVYPGLVGEVVVELPLRHALVLCPHRIEQNEQIFRPRALPPTGEASGR
jgi:hypothetical protein